MNNLVKKIFHKLVLLLQKVVNYLVRIDNKLHNNLIEIIDIVADKNLRMKTFHLHNISLLEGKTLFREIYNTLNGSDEYVNFGHTKIIILRAVSQNSVYTLHPNVLIDNNTSFETYYETVKDKIEYIFDSEEYELNIYTLFEMQVFDMSLLSNKDVKITRKALNRRMFSTSCKSDASFKTPTIAPIPVDNHETVATPIGTLDLETVNIQSFVLFEQCTGQGVQECVCITFYNKELGSKLFLIDHDLLLTNSKLAIANLWLEFFKYLENDIFIKHPLITIFVHNLGSFDGYFLYKQLSLFIHNHPIREGIDEGLRMNSDLNCLFDKQNKFISIKYLGITFKDSYRVFPVSLANLCKITETKGKIAAYDIKFNDISFFKDEILLKRFISYALQDSKALYDSLVKLQNIYLMKYKVNIAGVFSTSTLSLKIFQTNFQKEIIPILSQKEDGFIRPSYFGGATDYYKAYGKNLHYYDVTSLYPFAMCKPLPGTLKRIHKDLNNIKLEDFFGFIKCEITIDCNVLKPMVPFKYKGKTIFPTGNLSGVYFSEELKAFSKLDGYKIKLLSGYEFEKVEYFNGYIEDFFNQKKISIGAERFIAKMHLNQLYGYFGRSYDILNTINVTRSEMNKILQLKLTKTFINLAPNLYIALVEGNIFSQLLQALNYNASFKIKNDFSPVNTNVSIASAITSYARIEMMQYKLNYDVLYSDTDSIFTSDKLPDHLIGGELGMMKDELEGELIREGYFFGIKQYGYSVLDKSRNCKITTVFAGVKRNSLTWRDILNLAKGESVNVKNDVRFYKSFDTLSISIRESMSNLVVSTDKNLLNNVYHPIHITTTNPSNPVVFYMKRMVKLINKFIQPLLVYFWQLYG